MINPSGPPTAVDTLTVGGVPTMGMGFPLFTGNHFFVDPVNGMDGNTGLNAQDAFATLYRAHDQMTAGNNDVCHLIDNGESGGSARLSVANKTAGLGSTATDGVLEWSKSACHLVGTCAPTRVSQRARIAPPTGTYTQATFGSGNFVVVTGDGCMFANFSTYHGFSTGGTNQICWTETGQRNFYYNVHLGGMGDQASADDAGSRSLKIGTGGQGENTFVSCVIGLDTVTRGAANASIEFAGATPRNTFIDCTLPFMADASTPLGIIGSGAGNMDRWQEFIGCRFINNVQSTSSTLSGLSTLAASSGGLILMKGCTMVGITEWGTDATSRGQIYVDGAAPTAASSGIAVNPT